MRPPEHWHLRRQQPRRWRRPAALGALLLLVLVVATRCWPSEGGAGLPEQLNVQPPAAQPNDGCTGGVDCVQGAGGDFVAGDAPPPRIRGRAAVVVEDACGSLLYAHNADLRLPPASLTKITTALVAAEHAPLTKMVDVQVNSALLAVSTGSSVMGLEPGMRLSMGDLLYGLLLPSGNDAAVQIAQEVAGTIPAFVSLMNARAQSMHLQNTHFANPHGLDQAGHYTSARDVAELGRALLAKPELAAIVRTKQYHPAWNGPDVWNGNELLEAYPGTVGVKIGYTEKAGQTMVAAADRDGRRIIVSVLSSSDRNSDVMALFDWAFAHTEPACAGSVSRGLS